MGNQAKEAGLDVVLITGRWMSPVAAVADVVLPVEVEAIPFDTFVGLMALVEIIAESVMSTNEEKNLRRMRQLETHAVSHARTARDRGGVARQSLNDQAEYQGVSEHDRD